MTYDHRLIWEIVLFDAALEPPPPRTQIWDWMSGLTRTRILDLGLTTWKQTRGGATYFLLASE